MGSEEDHLPWDNSDIWTSNSHATQVNLTSKISKKTLPLHNIIFWLDWYTSHITVEVTVKYECIDMQLHNDAN